MTNQIINWYDTVMQAMEDAKRMAKADWFIHFIFAVSEDGFKCVVVYRRTK